METNTSSTREIGIGVIGMGGFGLFAVQQFLQTPHARLVAIAGSKREEAITTAKRFICAAQSPKISAPVAFTAVIVTSTPGATCRVSRGPRNRAARGVRPVCLQIYVTILAPGGW